jgi:sporulation integral membrane protein YlbJ
LSYTTFVSSAGKFLSPITKKLYGVGGVAGYVYFMSIISGYPIGAKLTSDLYQNNQISSSQAKAISSFTSTSGPLFILGTVGNGLFNDSKLGIIVLISHFISALLNGLLYRNKDKTNYEHNAIITEASSNPLGESMSSSIISIMSVGGFIALFYMVLSLLLHLNFFALPISLLSKIGIDSGVSNSILSGIIEVTTGLSLLSKTNISFGIACIATSFLVSFGGLSIHAQAYCYLKNFNLKYSHFLKQKVTHAVLSALVTWLITLLI